VLNSGAIQKLLSLSLGIFLVSCGPSHEGHDSANMPQGSMGGGSGGMTAMNKDGGDAGEDVLAAYLKNEASHPGASKRGQVFDYGPRQFPLNPPPQTIPLKSPIRSCKANALQSINFAFAYIHAFETVEAERYFRLAFHQDSNCTMALWGAGLTQIIFGVGNYDRGYKFTKLSIELTRHLKLNLTKLEIRLQNILLSFLKAPKDSENQKFFIKAWLQLVDEHPNELDLKALGALFIWDLGHIKNLGYNQEKVEKLFQEIFKQEPMHPAHHARIHLWNDSKNEKRALDSAEKIGPSFINSAHMWHMASHIYAQIGKFFESDEQYLRAAYIDQTQQNKHIEFPYMVHNYGHNQHFWGLNQMGLGKYKKSAELAEGLLQMPLHSKYNNPLEQDGIYHSNYNGGLDLLFTTANYYGNHAIIVEAEKQGYLPTDARKFKDKTRILKLFYQLAYSYTVVGEDVERFKYRVLMHDLASQHPSLAPLATSLGKILDLIKRWESGEASIETIEELRKLNLEAGNILSRLTFAKFYRTLNLPEKAEEILGDLNSDPYSDVAKYLELAHAQASQLNQEAAFETFEKCRTMGAFLDKDSEYYKLGEEVLSLLGQAIPDDWRASRVPRDLALKIPASFTGEKFPLPTAPDFALKNATLKTLSLDSLLKESEKGLLLVFVLGGSCPRCNEQLQELNIQQERFKKLGYKVVGITTDSESKLASTLEFVTDETRLNFDLLSDSEMNTFKKYRSYDDFEALPLHGTYVIDKNKRIKFLDRGVLPFGEFVNLIEEIKRLDQISKATSN